MADDPQENSSTQPNEIPDDEENALHEGEELENARDDQTTDDDKRLSERTENELKEEMDDEENEQGNGQDTCHENELDAEERPEVETETRPAGDTQCKEVDGDVRNSQNAVGQEEASEKEQVGNQLGDGVEGREAAGRPDEQLDELKLDGSACGDVAVGSSKSGREGLELKLEENRQEEEVDEETVISPSRRKLAVKPISLDDTVTAPAAEEPQQANSPQQPVIVAHKVASSLDELTAEDFIAGVMFDAKYLGSTQMFSSQPASKSVRMTQAHEAVSRVKQPEGESQPKADIYILVSTQKITIINALDDCALMEHPLRTISYIADIGNILVLMARRKNVSQRSQSSVGGSSPSTPLTPASGPPSAPTVDTFTPQSPVAPGGGQLLAPQAAAQSPAAGNGTPPASPVANMQEGTPVRQSRIICHVLESENAQTISRSIGEAFNVAYHEFLRTHGIEEEGLADSDYADVLSVQKMPTEDLSLFSDKSAEKEVVIVKKKGEILGVMLMESGWGSMVPTAVIAHMAKNGPAARTSRLNVGDQITCVNGQSLVGLTLDRCTEIMKECRNMLEVKLTVIRCPPVVQVAMIRPDVKYSLGFSVQNGTVVSILRGSIAERGGVRVGHRIIDINGQSTVDTPHERIVETLATATGEIKMKTMPTFLYRLITGQELPQYV